MTPDEAARLLRVRVGASTDEVQAAYRRRAREAHPDRHGSPEAFMAVGQARDALLTHTPSPAIPAYVRPPARPSRPLIATWIGIALIAAFLATVRSALPLTIAEPLIRYAVLLTALVAYAVTGRQRYLVIAVIAIAATVVMTIAFATLGSLVGLLILIAPIYGLAIMGVRRGVRPATSRAR